MSYVYVLVNRRTNRLYIGFSNNLRNRISDHQRKDSDWQLAYYEAYSSEHDARKRERDLKQYGSAWGYLKKRISNSLGLRKGGEALSVP